MSPLTVSNELLIRKENLPEISATSVPNKRRAVACKACHSLKVKCIPSDLNDLTSSCVRCIKSKKTCEIDVNQTRKKRKVSSNNSSSVTFSGTSTEDKIGELQGKINALTELLRKTQEQQQVKNISPSEQEEAENTTLNTTGWSSSDGNTMCTSSSVNESPTSSEVKSKSKLKKTTTRKHLVKLNIKDLVNAEEMAEASNYITNSAQANAEIMNVPLVDIIQDRLLTEDEARDRFKIFHDEIMSKHCDVSVTTDFDQLRKETPILFTTVMAVASILIHASIDTESDTKKKAINAEIEGIATRQTIYQILVIGNKTIELLKSLILLTTWYNLPELFHHRRYHIFNTIAIQLIQDLGLTGRPYYVVNKSEGSVQQSTVLHEADKEEYKALLLSVYTSSINYSLFLRRKFQVSWTPYLEECSNVLAVSENVGYRSISTIARLTAKLEKIHNLIDSRTTDNPTLMAHFIKEIDSLKRNCSTTLNKNMFNCFVNSIYVFLYSKSSTVEMNLNVLKFCKDSITDYASLQPSEMCTIPFFLTGRFIYCFTAYLKTGDTLKVEPDAVLIKKVMDLVSKCHMEYPNSTIYAKMRLLLMFYVTTFSKKNEGSIASPFSENTELKGFPSRSNSSSVLTFSSRKSSLSPQNSIKSSESINKNQYIQSFEQPGSLTQFRNSPHSKATVTNNMTPNISHNQNIYNTTPSISPHLQYHRQQPSTPGVFLSPSSQLYPHIDPTATVAIPHRNQSNLFGGMFAFGDVNNGMGLGPSVYNNKGDSMMVPIISQNYHQQEQIQMQHLHQNQPENIQPQHTTHHFQRQQGNNNINNQQINVDDQFWTSRFINGSIHPTIYNDNNNPDLNNGSTTTAINDQDLFYI